MATVAAKTVALATVLTIDLAMFAVGGAVFAAAAAAASLPFAVVLLTQ